MGRSERQDDEGNAKTQWVLNKNVARERRTEESLTETISVRRHIHTQSISSSKPPMAFTILNSYDL